MAATETGSHWQQAVAVALHPASKVSDQELSGVGCVSVTVCVADGYYSPKSPVDLPMTALYSSGKWSHAAMLALPANAAPLAKQTAILDGIACTRTGYCVVVGFYTAGKTIVPMVAART
jgi:hypothetical protein